MREIAGVATSEFHLVLEDVLDGAADNRFSFAEPVDPGRTSTDLTKRADIAAGAGSMSSMSSMASMSLEELARAHAATGTAAYCWNVADDTISWSGNAGQVLRCDPAALPTGRQFADFLDSDNITSRYDTVMGSGHRDTSGEGVPFEIEYCFRPLGRNNPMSLWLEDCGRWYSAADTGPALVYGLIRVIDERHSREQELKNHSGFDELTGMMNRARMIEALNEAIAAAKAEKGACSFALLAVNNLHVMNETYGYEAADEVIVALAQRLRRVMRVGDAIARYSGSKFGIILNGCRPDELAPALERLMRAVRDNVIETSLGPIWALLSIGAVNLPALGDTAPAAAAFAAEALSEALRQPNDNFVIYSSSEGLKEQRLLNTRCATEIVECLREGRFKLAFQPVAGQAGDVLFHEALLRMEDTSGTLVEAGHLVPMAESLGLVRLIDRAVVQTALAILARHKLARLSVNVSATTVKDPRWNAQILDLMSAAPELASRLIIEVTETAALGKAGIALAFLKDLRAAGCGIAIDDFGAGFTAYKSLQELPFTMIKLDGAFCRELGDDNGNTIYVRSMAELAHSLGIVVVAKQVERQEDATALHALGVDLVQGNVVGKPSIAEPWEHEGGEDSLLWNGAGHGNEVPAPETPVLPQAVEAATSDNLPLGVSAGEDPSEQHRTGQPDEIEDQLAQLHQVLQDLREVIGNAANEPAPGEDLSLAS